MSELKPCPFCGGRAFIDRYERPKQEWRIRCFNCPVKFGRYAGLSEEEVTKAWNRRTAETVKGETNIYDKEEIFPDCTVQVLTNTATGETSVGWWKNG